jgi:hypothetical protein
MMNRTYNEGWPHTDKAAACSVLAKGDAVDVKVKVETLKMKTRHDTIMYLADIILFLADGAEGGGAERQRFE